MRHALIRTAIMRAATGLAVIAISSALAQPMGPVSKDELFVPQDYRLTYQSLGSWAIAADNGQGSKQMHNVLPPQGRS